jgi:Cu/Ag efflux protein CusF
LKKSPDCPCEPTIRNRIQRYLNKTKQTKRRIIVKKTNKKTIGLMIIAVVCLMLVSGCKCMKGDHASCANKAEKPVVSMGEKPSRAMGEEVSLTATVTAIDYDARNITLKGPQGNSVTLNISDDAYNFNQVKVGDLVDITYFESVVVQLTAGDLEETPSASTEKGMIRAPEGQKPEGVVYDVLTVKAVVEDIDYDTRTVSLKGLNGNIVTVKVDDRVENLNNVKKGDMVNAQYTEAMAISVRPAE